MVPQQTRVKSEFPAIFFCAAYKMCQPKLCHTILHAIDILSNAYITESQTQSRIHID